MRAANLVETQPAKKLVGQDTNSRFVLSDIEYPTGSKRPRLAALAPLVPMVAKLANAEDLDSSGARPPKPSTPLTGSIPVHRSNGDRPQGQQAYHKKRCAQSARWTKICVFLWPKSLENQSIQGGEV